MEQDKDPFVPFLTSIVIEVLSRAREDHKGVQQEREKSNYPY